MNCSSVVPYQGFSPSGTGCFSMGPPWGHKPCQQTCSSVGTSLHTSWQQTTSVRAPHGTQPPSGIHLLNRGVLLGLQVQIFSSVDLHGLQGHSLSHHGLFHGLQRNLCSGAWSTSSPPFSLTLVSAEFFLSHHTTPLSCRIFLPPS